MVLDARLEGLVTISEEEQVMAKQRSDTRLRSIVTILNQETLRRTKTEAEIVNNYCLNNELLYKEVKVGGVRRKLWAVLNTIRKSIVVRFHNLSGHFSVDRTVAKIRGKYYFPRMRRYT